MGLGQTFRGVVQRGKGAVGVLLFKPETPMSLAILLDQWAQKTPFRTFLYFEGRRWSFADFNNLVVRRAASLRKVGLNEGDTISLMMDNRPEFLLNAFALSHIGVVPALINTNLMGAGLRHATLVCKPCACLVGAEHLALFRSVFDDFEDFNLPVYVDDEAGPHAGALPDSYVDLALLDQAVGDVLRTPPTKVKGTDLVAYIYTSGTTGLPKAGRVLNARAVLAGYGFGLTAMGLGPFDVYYCCLPLFHSNGFLVALGSCLVSGATLALARKFSASRYWDDIDRSGATVFVYIGEVCRYLLASKPHPKERSHNIREIIGNGMRPDVWKEFAARFAPGRVHEFYGATEGNVNMINLTGKFGSVGRMPPLKKLDNTLMVRFDHDTQMPVRDPNGRCILCEPDEIGELLGKINKGMVTQRFDGYLNAEATKKKILTDVLEPGDAYFRSGDLLRKDAKGWFYFVDRIGDTFRWKGENVSTNEVGDAVAHYHGIEICNVYGVQIADSDGRAGMVALVMGKGAEFNPGDFYKHITGELPSFAQPAFVRLANAMSLTATFKLRKVDLVREAFDPSETGGDEVYFRNDVEKTYTLLTAASYDAIEAGEHRF